MVIKLSFLGFLKSLYLTGYKWSKLAYLQKFEERRKKKSNFLLFPPYSLKVALSGKSLIRRR